MAKRSWMKKPPRAEHEGQIHSKPPEFSGPFLVPCYWAPHEHIATCPGAIGKRVPMDRRPFFATARAEIKIYSLPAPTISRLTTAFSIPKTGNHFTGNSPSIRRAELFSV